MIRLRRDDFEDPHELAKFAATAGLTLTEFRRQFAGLVEAELPALVLADDLQPVEREGRGPVPARYDAEGGGL